MLILVTNRTLCKGDFLQRIQQLAKGKPHAIMLREKDLSLDKYEALAKKVMAICQANGVSLIINQNISVAVNMKLPNIHLSMPDFRNFKNELYPFKQIGVSIHSVDEAIEAQQLGASYLIAGHIFSTDCKKGVPPRGLSFLEDVCDSVTIPVFAIGGITSNRLKDIANTGAKGVCIMSEAMTCLNPVGLTNQYLV
ncbi:thiamine phosphate synthase [Neobacillus sp. LXY-4]|uniref:thiamine phosphate synthase n=1 Tax=Neobacillus sp. LXY-4 TaxID=3379826 RepID=UPI003EE12B3B